jgi:hypothetical protein
MHRPIGVKSHRVLISSAMAGKSASEAGEMAILGKSYFCRECAKMDEE